MSRSSNGLQKCVRAHRRKKRAAYRPLFRWRNSAVRLIKKIENYGFHGNKSGVCHGVACVAAHAMLLKQVDQFDRDLLNISKLQPNDANPQLDSRVFIEAVQFCQNPDKYPTHFPTYIDKPGIKRTQQVETPQHILTSLPFVQSTALAAQGGVMSTARFSGVYDQDELAACLRGIRAGMEKFPHPMAMLLSDDGHIIAVQYDTDEKVWIFVDLRKLPSRKYNCEEALAYAIAESLTPNLKKTVLSALVVVSKQNETVSKKAMRHSMQSADWRVACVNHAFKKRYFKRWLYIAAFEGCKKEVAFLLAHGVNPNQPVMYRDTPLTVAAYQGNQKIVSLLLSHGAWANDRRRSVRSSLFAALKGGHAHVARVLRQHGAR